MKKPLDKSSSQKENKSYTRDELVYLAKLYEKAEKYEEMFGSISRFISMNPNLNLEERNLMTIGLKNLICLKRISWRYLLSQLKKEERKNSTTSSNSLQIGYINEVKAKVESEMDQICIDNIHLLDIYLIPNARDTEFKAYYLKLKADYMRYNCEYSNDKALHEKTESAYKEAYELSENELPENSATRLGLALNYSVFLYEIRNQLDDANKIAKKAFDQGVKILDELEKNKNRDTILIIQLLKENLISWNSEGNEEEEALL